MRTNSLILVLCGIVSLLPKLSFAQSANNGILTAAKPSDSGSSEAGGSPQPSNVQGSSAAHGPMGIGVGVRMSSLGAGAEVALAVSRRSNLRAGFNLFDYSRTLSHDGINYAGSLSLRSVEAHYDFYPLGGFHVSPGLIAYDGIKATATASVPGGQSFSLNGADYVSDPANPVTGAAKVTVNKVAPSIMVGFGNLVRRRGRRFAINFEIGAAYHGTPQATLNLVGGVCLPGLGCETIVSDPVALADVAAQQAKFNHDASHYRFYPLVSLGIGYRLR